MNGLISTDEQEVVITPEVQKIADDLTNLNLRDFIARLEEQKVRLLLNLKDYKHKLDQAKEDQTDIYYYLNKKLDDNYELIGSLETQILDEQADREITEKIYEKKIEELESKAESDEINYTGRINDLEEKLASLREFEELKEESETRLKQLLDTLESERAKFREAMEAMELKTTRERDRLRKEQDRVVAELKAKARDEILTALDAKTKETWEDNQRMHKEMQFQSAQANEVLKINSDVVARDRELRSELELAHGAEKELLERLVEYQQIIKELTGKLDAADQRAQVEEARAATSEERRKREVEDYDARIQQLEDRYASNLKDEGVMWTHLRESFTRMMNDDGNAGTADGLDADGNIDRNRVLVSLFRSLLHKYPQKFRQLLRVVPKERSTTGSTSLPQLASPVKMLKASGMSTNEITRVLSEPEQVPQTVAAAQDGPPSRLGFWDSAASVDESTLANPQAGGKSVQSYDWGSVTEISEGGMGMRSNISNYQPPSPVQIPPGAGQGVAKGRSLGVASFQFADSEASNPSMDMKSQGTSFSRKVGRINRHNKRADAASLGMTPKKNDGNKPGAQRVRKQTRHAPSPEKDVQATEGLLRIATVTKPGTEVIPEVPGGFPPPGRGSGFAAPTLYISQVRSATPGSPVSRPLTSVEAFEDTLGPLHGLAVALDRNPVDMLRAQEPMPDIADDSIGTPQSSMTLSPRLDQGSTGDVTAQ